MTKQLTPETNLAFIDAQNLVLSFKENNIPWKIDLIKFRVYLKQKYKVEKAYYFVGAYNESLVDLYDFLQHSGYIIRFREHSPELKGKKKGNVDTDIVFSIMHALYKHENFDKIVLVSGDGDYFRMVKFLIEENKFEKLLAPCKNRMSTLYQKLDHIYVNVLNTPDMEVKLALKK